MQSEQFDSLIPFSLRLFKKSPFYRYEHELIWKVLLTHMEVILRSLGGAGGSEWVQISVFQSYLEKLWGKFLGVVLSSQLTKECPCSYSHWKEPLGVLANERWSFSFRTFLGFRNSRTRFFGMAWKFLEYLARRKGINSLYQVELCMKLSFYWDWISVDSLDIFRNYWIFQWWFYSPSRKS